VVIALDLKSNSLGSVSSSLANVEFLFCWVVRRQLEVEAVCCCWGWVDGRILGLEDAWGFDPGNGRYG